MSLNNYSNLQTAVINFCGKDNLSDTIVDHITLAEDIIYNNNIEGLRILSMVSAATEYTLSGRFLDIPDDLLEVKQFRIQAGGETLELKSATDGNLVIRSGTGRPTHYSIGSQFQFNITPDQSYILELTYYKKPAPLSISNPVNDVLTNHPNLYLYGALHSVYDFSAEEQKSVYFLDKLLKGIKGANKSASKQRMGSSLSVVQRSGTP